MNKYIFSAIIAAIAATAVSCQKSELDDNQVPYSVAFGIEGNTSSKSYLAGGPQKWGGGTKYLRVYDDANKSYSLTSTSSPDNGLTRVFEGEMDKGKLPAYFFYAASYTPTCENGVFYGNGCTISSSQSVNTNNSCRVGQNRLVAKPSDSSLRNICGFFKWSTQQVTVSDNVIKPVIKKVRFETLRNNEYLSGNFSVDYTGDDPVLSITGSPNTYVESLATQSAPKNNGDYVCYAIVYPGTYHGIKLTIYLDDAGTDYFMIQDPSTFVVERSQAINFGLLPTAPIPTE
ncbi:MAG: hypothetical protein J5632_02585 [Bacteroidales bacterium]|nr:hypothetical protein [Bacteroidales bacterium]